MLQIMVGTLLWYKGRHQPWKVAFKYGTVERYFATDICEKLFSPVYSEGREFFMLKEISKHQNDYRALLMLMVL